MTQPSTPVSSPAQPRFNVLEALATWFVPGLGHVLLGQRLRGSIIGITIGATWIAGLLIGGIGVIDRQEHVAWFLGQALVAPSILVDTARGYLGATPIPGPGAAYVPSFGRPNEQGTLFTALAGMLNLLAIVDVIYCDPAQRLRGRGRGRGREQEQERQEQPA
ncbi:MAG: DUF6677 family protein [Phycisphaeraceae bacterium]